MAWLVYLTIGNVSKHICCQPMHHASILVGYLPVSKLETFENNSVAGYCLFHYCMRRLVQSLVAASREGVNMVCADGLVNEYIPCLRPSLGITQNNVWWRVAPRIDAPSVTCLLTNVAQTSNFPAAIKTKQPTCYARSTSPLYYLPYPEIELPTSLQY